MGDYISEDFLQILEVNTHFIFNCKNRNIESYVKGRGSFRKLKRLEKDSRNSEGLKSNESVINL
jgi:hypothetical protein